MEIIATIRLSNFRHTKFKKVKQKLESEGWKYEGCEYGPLSTKLLFSKII